MNAMWAYWASSPHKGKEKLAVGEPEGQLSAHEKPDTQLTLTQVPQNEMPPKGIPEAECACGEPDAGVPPATTASAYTCQRLRRLVLRRLVLWAVLAPCLIGACLWLWGTYDAESYVTTALDEHLWRNFSAHVRYSVKAFDSKYPHNVLLVLFVVHAVQVLFCFPLLHVTKMMYGYFFDALHGFLICCCWELTLVMVFVVVATQNAPVRAPARELESFLVTVDALRDRRMLIPFMVGLHISSVPLVTSTCLVLFRVVSRWEFMLSHTVSTVFTSAKDAWLGQFLATSDGNAQNILIAAMVLSFSALLPTVLTVLLMGFAASTTGSGAKVPWSASLAPKRTAAKTNPDSVRVAMVEL